MVCIGGSPLFVMHPTSYQKNITLVCMGDSLTAYMQKDLIECEDNQNWTVLVAQQLGIKVINKGINGNSTTQQLARFHEDVILNHPDYCIIEECGNDIWQGLNTTQTMINITQMVSLCRQYDIVPIIMCSTPQFESDWWYDKYSPSTPIQSRVYWENPDKLPAMRTAEKNLCFDLNIPYIDVYSPLLLNATAQDLQYYAEYDRVHPSVRGYKKMAEAVIPVLKSIMGGN